MRLQVLYPITWHLTNTTVMILSIETLNILYICKLGLLGFQQSCRRAEECHASGSPSRTGSSRSRRGQLAMAAASSQMVFPNRSGPHIRWATIFYWVLSSGFHRVLYLFLCRTKLLTLSVHSRATYSAGRKPSSRVQTWSPFPTCLEFAQRVQVCI